MRMLLKASIPVDKGSQAIANGTLQQALQRLMEAVKPEAVYSTTMDGKRTGLFVFDLTDPSQIPVICEPLFRDLEAAVELYPVMTPEDIIKGLSAAGQPGTEQDRLPS